MLSLSLKLAVFSHFHSNRIQPPLGDLWYLIFRRFLSRPTFKRKKTPTEIYRPLLYVYVTIFYDNLLPIPLFLCRVGWNAIPRTPKTLYTHGQARVGHLSLLSAIVLGLFGFRTPTLSRQSLPTIPSGWFGRLPGGGFGIRLKPKNPMDHSLSSNCS